MTVNIIPTVVPSISLEHLHVDQFTLLIDRDTGIKKVNAIGAAYAVDAQANQTFNIKNMTVNEPNMDAAMVGYAIAQAQAVDLADAMAQIAAERAAVTAESPSIFKLMAYFEQGVGKVFEIVGETVVTGVE